MLRSFWMKFDRDWGWNLARLLAYTCLQALFAVVGLQLIVFALGLRLAGPEIGHDVTTGMLRLLPDHVTRSAVASFESTLRQAHALVLLLGLPVALWYGTRFFVVLESIFCVIFRRRQRPFLQQNRMALLMLLLFAVLLPIIVLSATFEPHIKLSLLLSPAYITDDPLIAVLGFGAGFAANFLLLLVAYMNVTPGAVSFRAAWPGALLSACLVQMYMLIFPLYVRNVLHPDHFGTIAGFVLVVVVFFYAYALFIVIGAELAAWREGYRAASMDVPGRLAQPRLVYRRDFDSSEDDSDLAATHPRLRLPLAEGTRAP